MPSDNPAVITVDPAPEPNIYALPPISVTDDAAGDVLLPYTMPQAEYMCGCVATSVGMLLGYYDLYGCRVNGVRYDFSKLVPGTISIKSRGSDGGNIYDMTDPSVLATFIASPEYKARFYKQEKDHEKPYTFVNSDPSKGLNLSAWNCLADYLGTGQYWRGLGDNSTGHYSTSLEFLASPACTWTYDVTTTLSIPAKWHDFKYGLSLYLDTIGYALDERHTFTVDAEDFTFDDFKRFIDAGSPVLVSLTSTDGGHMVIAYGYNAATKEIIFDDTYRTDCRMSWNSTYYYAGAYYSMSGFSVVTLKTDEAQPPVEVYRGYVPVSSGSFIYSKTLTSTGSNTKMYVNRGGSASAVTVANDGTMYVSQGGFASKVTADYRGFVYVCSGGIVSSATLNYGYAYVSGGSVRQAVINSNGVLYVRSNGFAESAAVQSGGYLYVSNGGVARAANVNSSAGQCGYLFVYSGGIASTAVMNGGDMIVSNGGAAISAGVQSGGLIYLSSGGMMMSTVVSRQGYLLVSNGGKANTVLVSSGGSMNVSKGGGVNSVTMLNGGHAVVLTGASVNGLTVSSGGEVYVYDNAAIAGKATLMSGSFLWVYAGGTFNFDISNRTVNAGLLLNDITRVQGSPTFVVTVSANNQSSGNYKLAGNAASFNKTVTVKNQSGTTLGTVSVGGSLTKNGSTYSLTTSGGNLMFKVTGNGAISGAVNVYNNNMQLVSAADTFDGKLLKTAGDDARMYVRSGGAVCATTVSSGGSMYVSRGGLANFTLVLNSGSLTISSGGVASNTTISSGTSGGSMTVYRGGTVQRTFASGYLCLSSGTADETTVDRGGRMYVSGGYASRTAVNSSGNFYICSRGTANETTVNSSGHMYVSSSGAASRTTLNYYGSMCVYSGGVASATSVGNYGILHVSNGGTAIDNTVASNGFIYISNGGRITGKTSIENGAKISAYTGGVIDFNLAGVAVGDAVRINNLARVFGSPSYTVTVSSAQAYGEYMLAGGAKAFNGSVTVKSYSGATIGTVSVGGKLVSGDRKYTLVKDGDRELLSFTVDAVVAAAKTAVGKFTGVGGVFQLMADGGGVVRTASAATTLTGTLDPSKWELAAVGDFNGNGKDGLVWVEKSTGYAYMQFDMTSFADVTGKKHCLGVVGAGYSIKAAGDFSGSGIDGVLMQGPAFGDPSVSLNYGLPVWARDATGATFNGWLGALVNTWKTGDPLKGDLNDPASINANNYKYDIVGVGDFDGDGRDDVMLQNTMPKTVSGKTITGSGDVFTFLTGNEAAIKSGAAPTVRYAGCATDGWEVVGFGDFDHDGVDDALLSNGTGVAGWKMANGQRVDNFWFGNLSTGQSISGVADVDNDGTDDIIIVDAGGDFSAWKVKNGGVTGSMVIA